MADILFSFYTRKMEFFQTANIFCTRSSPFAANVQVIQNI